MKTSYSFIALTIFVYSHVFSANPVEAAIPEPSPPMVAEVCDIGSYTLSTKDGITSSNRTLTGSDTYRLLEKTNYYITNPNEWRKAYFDYIFGS